MTRRIQWVALSLATLVLMPLTAFGAMPQSASLATAPVGSQNNAWGNGIASVLSRYTPITVRVQPYSGPPAWLPLLDKGDTDMGLISGTDALNSYKGIVIYKQPFRNTRILIIGGTLNVSFYVAKDANMMSVADLRGKRIPTDFPRMPILKLSTTAALASVGLTYNDIINVPVSDLQGAAQAFLEGRTDAGFDIVGSPNVAEANARKAEVKFLSISSTPEGAKRMADIYPGGYPGILKAGYAVGIVKDTAVLTNDVYLAASKEFGEEAAYEVVKALWNYNQELAAAYPPLREFTRERVVSLRATIPYHPGAIRFFKEKGIWSKEMEALQAKLMAQ